MINLELAVKLAEEYGFEVNKVKTGEGGMFYIDDQNKKVKVNDLTFEKDIDLNIKLSLNGRYNMFGKRESMFLFAA